MECKVQMQNKKYFLETENCLLLDLQHISCFFRNNYQIISFGLKFRFVMVSIIMIGLTKSGNLKANCLYKDFQQILIRNVITSKSKKLLLVLYQLRQLKHEFFKIFSVGTSQNQIFSVN